MPLFQFVARDSIGRSQNGMREAASALNVADELRSRGWLILEISESRSKTDWVKSLNPLRLLSPRSLDIEISLQQIAFMLRSGLPLLQSLRTCAEQCTRESMSRIWLDVAQSIQDGNNFSDSLSRHKCFSPMIIAMVGVGEQTGELDQVLLRAANSLERRRHLFTHLKTALSYPSIVLVMAIGVVIYMMLGVIPKLKIFLASSGRRLPPLTQSLIDISQFIQTYYLQGLIWLGVFVVLTFAIYCWPLGRLRIDKWLLRVPLFGNAIRTAATATFARALSSLVASGVHLTESLSVAQALHRNRYIASCIAATEERVLQGGTIAEPLARRGAFLPLLSSMVAVGEKSGTLDDVLKEVASFHELRLEAIIRRFSALIEPALIIIVGGIVGFIYIAFFMAIYSMAGSRP